MDVQGDSDYYGGDGGSDDQYKMMMFKMVAIIFYGDHHTDDNNNNGDLHKLYVIMVMVMFDCGNNFDGWDDRHGDNVWWW